MADDRKVQDNKAFIQDLVGYSFKSTTVLKDALDTRGILKPRVIDLYAMVGDDVLRYAILDNVDFASQTKGDAEDSVQRLANNRKLNKIGCENGIGDFVIGHPGQHGVISPRLMATAVEALIGAVFHDSEKDLKLVTTFIVALGLLDDTK